MYTFTFCPDCGSKIGDEKRSECGYAVTQECTACGLVIETVFADDHAMDDHDKQTWIRKQKATSSLPSRRR